MQGYLALNDEFREMIRKIETVIGLIGKLNKIEKKEGQPGDEIIQHILALKEEFKKVILALVFKP